MAQAICFRTHSFIHLFIHDAFHLFGSLASGGKKDQNIAFLIRRVCDFVVVCLFVCLFVFWRSRTRFTFNWQLLHIFYIKCLVVPEYDVTSPFQADDSGNFLSYKLHEHARRKRDAEEPYVWYYQVQAFGMSLHLNLTKNTNFLAPGLMIEKVHKNGSTEYSELPHTAFYDGHVTSDPSSVVAIGNHDGLVSTIFFSFRFHSLFKNIASNTFQYLLTELNKSNLISLLWVQL